jgi:membrane protein
MSSVGDRTRERIGTARARYEGSWIGAIGLQLKELDFVNQITLFGAALLWSGVPLIIVLSSLADEPIDDDLSRHIGLDAHGARIVQAVFRTAPAHAVVPIVTGVLFSAAGVVAVVGSLQGVYEKVFRLEPRGWRGLPRWIAWTGVVIALLVLEGALSGLARRTVGPIVRDLLELVAATLVLWWTMHYLLAGRIPWRALVRPAVVTGGLWLALGLFSSVYFSPVLISDSRTYGEIGVVFSLLTWFFLIGAVLVLGPVCGVVWQARSEVRARR